MELLSALALVLLSLVGYSSGNALALPRSNRLPGLLDLALVVVLWALAFAARDPVGKWGAIGVGVAAGIVLGFGAAKIAGEAGRPVVPSTPNNVSFKGRWKHFSLRMGNFQGRMTLAFFYFLVVTPFALFSRILKDPLVASRPERGSYWQLRPNGDERLETARRQY